MLQQWVGSHVKMEIVLSMESQPAAEASVERGVYLIGGSPAQLSQGLVPHR